MSDSPVLSHPKCQRLEAGIAHVCQEPSGRVCVEQGCELPAGTWWGPLWCPDHDVERLDRIGRSLRAMVDQLEVDNALGADHV